MGNEGTCGDRTEFAFGGAGGEYFRIWSVNLLLSILTLGIYSAWAKVRRERYFHRNTLLAGSGFDYHGDPRAILKGRCIAWGLVVLLGVAQKFSPGLYGVLVLALLPLMPWLVLRSLRFRAANTSYRGLRFRHRGTYREALTAYLGHGLLSLVSLGLWLPLWVRAMTRFQIGKLSFGDCDFECAPSARGYYGAYALAGLLAIGPVAVAGGLAATAFAGKADGTVVALLAATLPALLLLGVALLVRPFMQVRLTNLAWNASSLGGRRFVSNQALRSFFLLRAANVLFIVLSLGLYWPWAMVRETAYRMRHFAVAAADLDAFVGQAAQQPSAVGEEIADAFDLDLAL